MTTATTPTVPAQDVAVVVHGVRDLRVEQRAVPAPAPDEAVVRIAYGGVCGSDLHYWTHGAAGESVLRAPMVLGHEVVGTVVRAAADGTGPAAGTEVAVHPAGTTDPDAPHPPGRPNLSPAGTYLGSAARFPHTEGAFARHAVLRASTLRPLPAGLSLRTAAVAEPAAVAWHAVARAGDVAGRRVLVVGCGPIGLLVVAVLRRAGAAEIVVSDVHERPMALAGELGATEAVSAGDADAVAAVAADVVFESSGSPRGLASAVRGAARAGTVVMVGLLPAGEQPALISLAITRELDLRGSFRFTTELDDVLAALADGSLQAEPVVTHVVGVDDAVAGFELALDATASSKVLLEF